MIDLMFINSIFLLGILSESVVIGFLVGEYISERIRRRSE